MASATRANTMYVSLPRSIRNRDCSFPSRFLTGEMRGVAEVIPSLSRIGSVTRVLLGTRGPLIVYNNKMECSRTKRTLRVFYGSFNVPFTRARDNGATYLSDSPLGLNKLKIANGSTKGSVTGYTSIVLNVNAHFSSFAANSGDLFEDSTGFVAVGASHFSTCGLNTMGLITSTGLKVVTLNGTLSSRRCEAGCASRVTGTGGY